MNQDVFVDRPIAHAEEDLFGRKPFAETIAATIANWKGTESLTIAISGRWGSGKSSLKNLILEALPSDSKVRPYEVEFNPWKYASPSETAKAFFREISIALRRVDPTKTGEERAARWDKYGKLLTLTSELAQETAEAFPTLLALATFAGVSATITENPIFSVILIAATVTLVGVASALKFSAAFSSKTAEWIRATSSDESIEEIRAALQRDLGSLKRPVLVIVDDIDRLTRKETKQLFQHVKANADFPNVLYLLLYQRDIIEKHLTTTTVDGRRYLEKIVDLQFDLPLSAQDDINKILFDGLNQLLAKTKRAPQFDRTRWGNVYLGGLQGFFGTPRNVKRFLSTLAVQFKLFQGSEVFEVNPIDLIAIEALRVFEPDVFQAIGLSASILTTGPDQWSDRNQRKIDLEAIVALASKENAAQVRELIKLLFPRTEWAFGGSEYADDWVTEWTAAQRVCSPTFFARYFRLAVPSREMSQSDFQLLVDAAASRDRFVAEFRKLEASGKAEFALSRLDAHKEKISLNHASEFLPALLDIGDSIDDGAGAFLGPFARVTRVVLWYTRQEPELANRGKLLLAAMQKSDAITVMSRILRGEDERHSKPIPDQTLAMFTSEQLEQAKNLWLEKFLSKAATDRIALARMPRFIAMLYGWREWKGDAATREWVRELLATNDGLLAFLSSAAGIVTTTRLGDRTSKVRLVTNLRTIEDFTSIETIQARLQHLANSELSEEDKRAIESFQRAVRRRAEGKRDDGFGEEE
jgi:predicted KAP-like P-loop ATPase